MTEEIGASRDRVYAAAPTTHIVIFASGHFGSTACLLEVANVFIRYRAT
jgi:hypothetical protein